MVKNNPMLKVLSIMSPYIEWIDKDKMLFYINDKEANSKTISPEPEILKYVQDLFRQAGWMERTVFVDIVERQESKVKLQEIIDDLENAVSKKEVYQTTIGEERWIKLSPEGDFQASHDAGPPMYV